MVRTKTKARMGEMALHGVMIVLLGAAVATTWSAVCVIEHRRGLRDDLAELTSVRYGLLDPRSWLDRIEPILLARIEVFDLSNVNRAKLQTAVEDILGRLIDDVHASVREANLSQPGLFGRLAGELKQAAIERLVKIEEIRRNIPVYAAGVIERLEAPDSKNLIRQYLHGVLEKGIAGASGKVDQTEYLQILDRYGCATGDACAERLRARILEKEDRAWRFSFLALVSVGALFMATRADRLRKSRLTPWLLLLSCAALLIGGLMTPMIEIEAGIDSLHLEFLGAPVVFNTQTLYFRSKSIGEVFAALMSAPKPLNWLVGLLVGVCSVVLPTCKLAMATALLTDLRWTRVGRGNKIARFFVFEMSKWAMADVMVLALFMGYIGFDRVVDSGMAELGRLGASGRIDTVNGTTLQPGFLLFVGFCVTSLLFSSVLKREVRSRS